MQYKEAKMQKVIRIADAISATALGVANSLKVGGPVGIVLASLVGALGAVQVGIISSQPLPEKQSYATGGYTGNGYGQPDAQGIDQQVLCMRENMLRQNGCYKIQ